MPSIQPIKTIFQIDKKTFVDEILPQQEPIVIKSLVGDWPAIEAYRKSEKDLAEYLKIYTVDDPIEVVLGTPNTKGKFGAFFDHYVFQLEGKTADHLPEHVEDIISQLPENCRNNIKAMLAEALQPKS